LKRKEKLELRRKELYNNVLLLKRCTHIDTDSFSLDVAIVSSLTHLSHSSFVSVIFFGVHTVFCLSRRVRQNHNTPYFLVSLRIFISSQSLFPGINIHYTKLSHSHSQRNSLPRSFRLISHSSDLSSTHCLVQSPRNSSSVSYWLVYTVRILLHPSYHSYKYIRGFCLRNQITHAQAWARVNTLVSFTSFHSITCSIGFFLSIYLSISWMILPFLSIETTPVTRSLLQYLFVLFLHLCTHM
jgi:hypothetical protein